jgi:hypothetical protein
MSSGTPQFLEQNRDLDYPFVDGSLSSDDYLNFFVDAYFVHRRKITSGVVIYHIYPHLTNFQGSDGLLIHDGNGNTVFDVADFDMFNVEVSDDSLYYTFTWVRTELGDEAQLVVVVDTTNANWNSAKHVINAELVPRCVDYAPARVNRLLVKNAGGSSTSVTKLTEGTNIQLTQSPVSVQDFAIPGAQLRPENVRLEIAAIAGAGTGREEQSCTVDGIISINRITGADGRFLLDPDDCYWFNRYAAGSSSSSSTSSPIVRIQEGYLKLHNECVACCDCESFVDFYERIRGLVNRGCVSYTNVRNAASIYEQVVSNFNERAACSITDDTVSVRVMGYSYSGWLTQVMVLVINGTSCSVDGFYVDIALDGEPPAEYVEGTGLIYNNTDGTAQTDPTITTSVGNQVSWRMINADPIPASSYAYIVLGVSLLSDAGRIDGASKQFNVDVYSSALASSPTSLSTSVDLIGNRSKS